LLRSAALRLIAIGDEFSVRNGVAINKLYDDCNVTDGNARFWPQTERLKAALLAAALTGVSLHWSMAHAAASSFLPFLDTQTSTCTAASSSIHSHQRAPSIISSEPSQRSIRH